MAQAPLDHSYTVLDRWLLAVLHERGAVTAVQFAQDRDALAAGARSGAATLNGREVEGWLDSARRRGLLERYAIELEGATVQPPQWGLSDQGRARLAATIASTHFVPDWLGKTLLPLLPHAGKTLLALPSVYLAARATELIHPRAISPTAAQVAIL